MADVEDYVVKIIERDLLPKYLSIDGVVDLNHLYGCGVAINVPAAVVPIRTIHNIALNPNFGGEVMVVGMQCGGSDAFSGVTTNPALSATTLTCWCAAAATVMFSEVTEVRDAIHLLTPRAINEEVGRRLLEEMA
ncbi:UxaA family hydrolase [Escherichia coli]|nr:UxaA family hydrolase [Escherichia coli]